MGVTYARLPYALFTLSNSVAASPNASVLTSHSLVKAAHQGPGIRLSRKKEETKVIATIVVNTTVPDSITKPGTHRIWNIVILGGIVHGDNGVSRGYENIPQYREQQAIEKLERSRLAVRI